MTNNSDITDLWLTYNNIHNEITRILGRTSNIVCEFSELLVAQHYGGQQLTASSSSADVALPNGMLIQVKARKPRQGDATSLGIIRSWNFDLLVAVIFNIDGTIRRAVELSAEDAERLSVYNEHQNGWVITTTNGFYDDPAVKDITAGLKQTMSTLSTTTLNTTPSANKTSFKDRSHHSSRNRCKMDDSSFSHRFKDYLLSTVSPNTGVKYTQGTASSYVSGVNTVCKEENCSWEDLASRIGSIVFRYGTSGDKSEIGKKGHNTVINSLRAYQRFIAHTNLA